MVGNWTDSRISSRHSAPTSFPVCVYFLVVIRVDDIKHFCTGANEVEGGKEVLDGPENVTYGDYCWHRLLRRNSDRSTFLPQRHSGNRSQQCRTLKTSRMCS